MRWILVFIILYLIPLVVLFKNYNKFSRACIYGCTYVVLATTLVISNMYISGIKQLENSMKNFEVMNYNNLYAVYDSSEEDLLKVKNFKRDIRDIEDIALDQIKKCVTYTSDIETNLKNIESVKKDVDKAMYMCERVVEIYDKMEVPTLSQEEYTNVLKECLACMKEAYTMKYNAVKQVNSIINNKNISDIPKVKAYIENSDKKINEYKVKIYDLENNIQNK